MNTRAESSATQTPVIDYFLWVVVAGLLAGAVGGNWYFADVAVLYRALAVTAVGGLAGTLALQTTHGRALWNLMREARIEIRRVVWPTQVETRQTTIIVVVLVIIVALIMWGLDSVLGLVVSRIIG